MKKQVRRILTLIMAISLTMSVVPIRAEAKKTDDAGNNTTIAGAMSGGAVDIQAQPIQDVVEDTAVSKKDFERAVERSVYNTAEVTRIDLSESNMKNEDAKRIVDRVLENTNAASLVDVSYDTENNGDVTSVDVHTDVAYTKAVAELEAIAKNDSRVTEEELESAKENYAKLQVYYEANPDYFGLPVPFFTVKDEKNGPISALVSVIAWGATAEWIQADYLSVADVNQIIDGYFQVLYACVGTEEEPGYYREAIIKARDEALAQIDDGMQTPEEKMLALNDWLADRCKFDMAQMDLPEGYVRDENENFAYMVETTLFGALVGSDYLMSQGQIVNPMSMCIGYTAAYTYLVQCAFPEIYKKEIATGGSAWKTKEELVTLTDEGMLESNEHIIDFAEIKWDANVTLLGEDKKFEETHYFNAVRTNPESDTWYYIDSCYNDIYVECMGRNRVETDGNMTHSYFLVSNSTLEQQFDGNYSGIDCLYKENMNDTQYEDAWFTAATGKIETDGDYYYYVKNSAADASDSMSDLLSKKDENQLVAVKRGEGFDFIKAEPQLLIDFTKCENSQTLDGQLVENSGIELVKYAEEKKLDQNFSSIAHTVAYDSGKLYFNVANIIFTYDIETGKIEKFKEYNQVTAVKNKNIAFTGMAFNVVTEDTSVQADDEKYTVLNHPIAALSIKDDGKMYVSIATNYTRASEYKYEETNYNANYINYAMGSIDYKKGGDNDNDEYLWSANFVETISMEHVNGETHEYEEVRIAPTCTENGYIEKRCKTCGAADTETGVMADDEAVATGHHYILFEDETYQKESDSENNIVVEAAVCVHCMDSLEYKEDSNELIIPEDVVLGHEYEATASWADKHDAATLTIECTDEACKDSNLDFMVLNDYDQLEGKANVGVSAIIARDVDADITVENAEGVTCETGGEVTYVASYKIDDTTYEATTTGYMDARGHEYEKPEFSWKGDASNPICEVFFKCKYGDVAARYSSEDKNSKVVIKEESDQQKQPSCTDKGEKVYSATITVTHNEGKEETYTTKSDTNGVYEVAALGHDYEAPKFEWGEDKENATCKAIFSCKRNECDHKTEEACEIVVVKNVNPTCTEKGKKDVKAVVDFNGERYESEVKLYEVDAKGHKYGESTFVWEANYENCTAERVCTRTGCGATEKAKVKISRVETAATYVAAGKMVYKAEATYDDGEKVADEKTKNIPQLDSEARFDKTEYELFSMQSAIVTLNSKYNKDKIVEIKSSDPGVLSVTVAGAIQAKKYTGKTKAVTLEAKTESGKNITAIVKVRPTQIKLNATKVPVKKGKATTAIEVVGVSYSNDKISSVKSSDKRVVTVSKNGKLGLKVTGKKTSSKYVTITVTMVSGAKATCKVKVQKNNPKISKLILSDSKVNLKLKQKYQIKVTKNPVTCTSKVAFSSSNKKIATVNKSGLVVAKKKGTAKVYVKCGNKKKTLVVKVMK